MKRWAVLCGLAIIGIVVLADTRHLGFLGSLYSFPYGDKVGHFVLFGLLSALVNLAVFETRPKQEPRRLALQATGILAAVIGLEELSQRWFPSRTSSIWDLMASYLGVAVFTWAAIAIQRRRRDSSPQ
jgi:polysaccharide biosynthesis protein VpsQ